MYVMNNLSEVEAASDGAKVEQWWPTEEVTLFNYHEDLYIPLAKTSLEKIKNLENYLSTHDPGNRGLQNFVCQGDFVKAALHLALSKNLLLVTGFPCIENPAHKTPYENDGPQGIAALAKCLLEASGHRLESLTIAVDELSKKSQGKYFESSIGAHPKFKIVSGAETEANQTFREKAFDTILTSERAARNRASKKYMNMRMKELDENYIDDLNNQIKSYRLNNQHSKVISIGDGGNEFGMEKLSEVSEMCNIDGSCDFLIGAGVSNWACYALMAALEVLYKDEHALRYINHGLHTEWQDGMDFRREMSVDGMHFDKEHKDFIDRVNEII